MIMYVHICLWSIGYKLNFYRVQLFLRKWHEIHMVILSKIFVLLYVLASIMKWLYEELLPQIREILSSLHSIKYSSLNKFMKHFGRNLNRTSLCYLLVSITMKALKFLAISAKLFLCFNLACTS